MNMIKIFLSTSEAKEFESITKQENCKQGENPHTEKK